MIVLTKRQAQVLELIAEGKQADAIAHELGLGYGTVKVHIAHMLRSLGARNAPQAVAKAFRAGLLS